MVYITLDELKEILPDIFNEWMDDNDESWDWIFQEIEQKCHIGTKHKGKKSKGELKSLVDTHSSILSDHRDDIDELDKKVDELNNKISNLSDKYVTMVTKVNHMNQDVNIAKSMAQTARDRTQVDYAKISKELEQVNRMDHDIRKNAEIIQEVYDRMVGRGATKEELDSFIDLINKYDALEKKEIPVTKKMCVTCKYESTLAFEQPCVNCCHNNVFYNGNIKGTEKWEAKDNENNK